ncbi:MAG: AzlC family ABC transporter permease [Chloroflexi bacterium]|nr:AzlC family ABC transporter permease [Chloroflexota bacterium]
MSTARSEFSAGVRAQLPLMVGVIPFGLIYGALAVQLSVPASLAQGMSSIIFAGSAQFVAAPLFAAAAPGVIIVATVFVVNLRHALYSASIATYLERLNPVWKVLLAYVLTDEAYAVTIAYFRANAFRESKHWFLLGAGGMLWLCWQLSTAVGIFVGAQVPSSWSLDFALPLTFIALVIPMLKNRAYVTAAVVAGSVGVLTVGLPYKLGLLIAAVVGIAAGLAADVKRESVEVSAE